MSPENGAKVIAEARGLVGSHYIHGGYGATPGRSDGFPTADGRKIELIFDERRMDPTNVYGEQHSIAILAASTLISYRDTANVVHSTYSVCAGSFSTTKDGKGNLSESDHDVEDVIRILQKASFGQFNTMLPRLTPRRVFGPRPQGKSSGELVLGEACANVRHFDCVGFISYCVWKALHKKMQLEIKLWREPYNSGGQVFEFAKNQKPGELRDADVLIQADHHIGFVTKDGALIQAEDSHLGVRETPGFKLSAPGNWTHLVRLPDYVPDKD